jgi:CRAL/TRIO domain
LLVTGVGLSHLSGEVKRLISTLTKYDQDNYPEMLGRICIINAPMVFKAVWALIKPLLNPRTLSKIQVRVRIFTLAQHGTWLVGGCTGKASGPRCVVRCVLLDRSLG